MPKFAVDIPHSLTPEEAKQRLSGATGKLEQSYGAACTWKSDTELSVSRKGLDARVVVEPSRVHIDMNLGFLLTPFAERIKAGITKELTAILG
jgi:putative polyhydroxyalkanoate system protein